VPAVFISYSRRDKDFVGRLHDALKQRQYDVWVDWEDIPPSAEWFQEIRAGLGGADGFVYVISPDSLGSKVCTQELDYAVEQHKRIVPVVRRDTDGAKVPDAAAELNWIFLREGDDFDGGVGQLVSALEQDLDHVRTHTRLGVAATRWDAGGREPSQLLRGAELAAAEGWLVGGADKQPAPTQLQREYVLASRQAATRRQRTVIGGVTFALVVAVVLAVVALIQRSNAIHERNVAYARQLDAEAQSNYPTDPELSVLLADKAAQVVPGSATEEGLREALAQSRIRIRYTAPGNEAEAMDAVWNSSGTRLLVTSPGAGGWARIYTPGSYAAPVTLGSAPQGAGQSAWDARGDRVAIGGPQPAVYNAFTGRLVARIRGNAIFTALTSDGTRAITVDTNSVGHVFDLASGRQLATFHPRYTGAATCLALAPDDSVVAQCDLQSLSNQQSPAALDTWSVASGKLLHSIPVPSVIGSVAFSPDSKRYVFTTPNPVAGNPHTSVVTLARAEGRPGTFVYDTASGQLVKAFGGSASAAAFSPLAQLPEVAYATVDDVAHVYSFVSGETQTLTGATDTINSVRWDQYGTDVITASNDKVARVYNALTGGNPIETLAGHAAPLLSASFGAGDARVATASSDGTVRVWAGPTPLPSAVLPPSELAPLADFLTASLSFSADSAWIVQATENGKGQVLDAHSLQVLARFAPPPGQGFAGAQESRNGRVVVALSGPLTNSGALAYASVADLYDPSSGRPIATLTPPAAGPLIDAALDYQGDKLVTLSASGAADIWDTQTGKLLHQLPGTTIASGAAFSRDGSQLAIVHYPTLPRTVTPATSFGDVTIDIWNPDTGQRERTIIGETLIPQEPGTTKYAPLTVAFSPDGSLLAVAGADPGVQLYNPHTGGAPHRPLGIEDAPGGSYADSLAFSPNGKLLAAGSASGAYVWQVPSYTHFDTFQHVPEGSASAYVGGGAGVQVGFSDDSNYLLTSGDSVVNAWDIADHLELFHAEFVTRGALSPDATQVVTAGQSGVAVYLCELCGGLSHLLAVAKRNTTRSFTSSERALYLTQG
jgi:WD40 repeat protein